MRFSELVKRERDRHRWSGRELARRAGVDPAAITRIEKHHQLGRADTVARITAALGIDPAIAQAAVREEQGQAAELVPEPTLEQLAADLLARVRREEEAAARRRAEYEALPSGVIMVPIVESFAAAGEGAVAEAQTWAYVPTSEEAGHRFIAVRVRGSCLAPRVVDGDLAVIDRDAEPRPGDVLAAQVDGESLLRILAAGELVSLNGHPPIPLTDAVHVEGVVVFVGRRP